MSVTVWVKGVVSTVPVIVKATRFWAFLVLLAFVELYATFHGWSFYAVTIEGSAHLIVFASLLYEASMTRSGIIQWTQFLIAFTAAVALVWQAGKTVVSFGNHFIVGMKTHLKPDIEKLATAITQHREATSKENASIIEQNKQIEGRFNHFREEEFSPFKELCLSFFRKLGPLVGIREEVGGGFVSDQNIRVKDHIKPGGKV